MEEEITRARQKSVLWGVTGGVLLLAVYFLIVSFANSFQHAVDEFVQLWYWIAPLTVGFGLQVGLYAHVRQTIQLKEQARGAKSAVAAGGGLSTLSMIACCAHHLTDFLPILGLSAAAIFLTSYQLVFILVGILSNVVGTTYMLSIIARHRLYFDANRWLAKWAGLNYKRVFRIEIPALLVVLLLGIFALPQVPEVSSASEVKLTAVDLEAREVAGNGIWVTVAGRYEPPQRSLTFVMKFTTHSGSMDFEVDKIAALEINGRPVSLPVVWNGSPPGGHHRSGVLRFEQVPANVKSVRLVLSSKGRFGEREFSWEL